MFLLFLPFSVPLLLIVSSNLSDHQAVCPDPGQGGTVSLSCSFQPCPPDHLLLLLFFFLYFFLRYLLSRTTPSERTLLIFSLKKKN